MSNGPNVQQNGQNQQNSTSNNGFQLQNIGGVNSNNNNGSNGNNRDMSTDGINQKKNSNLSPLSLVNGNGIKYVKP